MKQFPDKHFELACVDPPYGIGMDNSNKRTKPSRPNSYTNYKDFRYHKTDWDKNIPPKEYFTQLFRVSRIQIIWGANYFSEFLPSGFGWIFWNKLNGLENCFSDGEFAFASKGIQSKYFECSQFDGTKGGKERIHPTQKPIKLYKWIFDNYGKCNSCSNKGWVWLTKGKQTDCPKCKGIVPKILDTHLGSQSSRIAAYEMGFDFYGCELDPEYFEQGNKRFEAWRKMNGQQLFDFNDFVL